MTAPTEAPAPRLDEEVERRVREIVRDELGINSRWMSDVLAADAKRAGR